MGSAVSDQVVYASPAVNVKKPEFVAAPKFKNGWPCPQCGCMTEHQKVRGQEVCLECGHKLGKPVGEYFARPEVKAKKREYFARPEVKAKQREYAARPEVKAKKREYKRKKQLEKLKAKLAKLRMEAPTQ